MSAEGGGGGHGASWIVTYSDMITLLMTLFIVIVTFGTKQQDRQSKRNDSLVGGKGGTGAAGPNSQGADRTAVMPRVTPLGRPVVHGSETAPLYSDPADDAFEAVQNGLNQTNPGRLSDNFSLRVPAAFLFADDMHLSESGMRTLKSFGGNVRDLPFDIQVQVAEARRLPRAAAVMQYLFQAVGIHPARIGIAVRPNQDGGDESVWLLLLRNR